MKPVSIIVPVYKVEPYLRRCVDSILDQTFTDFELILVDDGSPDNCPAICDEYAKNDERIRVIHKKNGGVSSARNVGMKIAQGKYFLFCDSDDYVSPYWCEALYKQIEKSPDAWVYCDLVRVEDTDLQSHLDMEEKQIAQNVSYYQTYLMGLSAYTPNKIYSATKIRDHAMSFCESEPVFEDVDFNLKYLAYCDGCVYIPLKLYAYVQHSDSIMHSYNPDWFAMHLLPFYGRIPFIGEENVSEYCDIWLYHFLRLFPVAFDKRNPAPWFKKFAYNQRMLSSKEFQFCLRHASGKNENPLTIRILKTRCYLLYWLFDQIVRIKQQKLKDA
ncbi:MAG: glycosyltransferase family 2 protein [Candidatus Faecousia sp.]|uniref:glycosyltransferase family 2 protein n=1 Tax=Faecousia sp. TaxID=2952921 RepID=UPI002A8AB4B1|nr:glycosyltransferase family 2 protein [Candidatus Faecousia sp.]